MIRAATAGVALALCLLAGAGGAEVAAVTSQNAGALTLVDTGSLQVLATLPLPGKPAAVAVDGRRGRILAVAVETARLHVFDLAGAPLADWPLSGAPFGLAIRPQTGMALVTDQAGNLLREIDPVTGQELAQWQTGALPSGVAEAEGVILVANRDGESVTLIRGAVQQQIPVGHHPFGVTLNDGRGFVTDVLSDQVSVIDLASAAVIATIPTGERPYAVAFAAGRGFVTNQYAASLTVFDAQSLAVIAEIATDDYPEGIAATTDGQILVANWFSDTLQVIDPVALQVNQTLDMPEGPRAFGAFVGGP
ncbi:YncE family protein [Xinfangfangia pollutisoli]|uniref:YncE family protein n=1 Tax=Xinfangfangia pollutisoli TaxID=2865960 RepID=UPI001CD273D4|nr:YncE family protein [Xinfangfangia pollutisoli]